MIVERETGSSVMYPEEADTNNPFGALSKAGSEFRDKIASRMNLGLADEEKNL